LAVVAVRLIALVAPEVLVAVDAAVMLLLAVLELLGKVTPAATDFLQVIMVEEVVEVLEVRGQTRLVGLVVMAALG